MSEPKPDIELGGVFTVTIRRAFDVTATDGELVIHTDHAALILPPPVVSQVLQALADDTGRRLESLAGEGA